MITRHRKDVRSRDYWRGYNDALASVRALQEEAQRERKMLRRLRENAELDLSRRRKRLTREECVYWILLAVTIVLIALGTR